MAAARVLSVCLALALALSLEVGAFGRGSGRNCTKACHQCASPHSTTNCWYEWPKNFKIPSQYNCQCDPATAWNTEDECKTAICQRDVMNCCHGDDGGHETAMGKPASTHQPHARPLQFSPIIAGGVLQHGEAVAVWGHGALPHATVTVRVQDQSTSTDATADAFGNWSIQVLPHAVAWNVALTAASGGQEANTTVTFGVVVVSRLRLRSTTVGLVGDTAN